MVSFPFPNSTKSITPSSPAVPIPLVPGADAGTMLADVPAATPLLLSVNGTGPYEIRVAGTGSTAATATPAPAATGLTLTLESTSAAPAAYWPDAQTIDLVARITNDSDTALDLAALTGHYDWAATFAEPSVTVAAGETVDAALTVRIAPDAWADRPVFVAVQASGGGSRATALTTITPERTVPPVAPSPWDPVPEAMLGGLNVAWTGLGAAPVADDPAVVSEQAFLYDELPTQGTGWRGSAFDLPLELIVDLAGDEAIPVSGTVLFPPGPDGTVGSQVRAFELDLSEDGVTFDTVLSSELRVIGVDQAFALDAPVAATHARLRIVSAHGVETGSVSLGEWRVMAEPGWMPGGPVNLAAPALGGHIVDLQPPAITTTDWPQLLTIDDEPITRSLPPDSAISWTVGFHHDRAALIDELVWTDPPDSDPDARIDELTVEVSADGPAGPWTHLATWTLDREADGVATLPLDEPVWARFVRFSARITTGEDLASSLEVIVEYPDAIAIHEVTDQRPDGYLSALGAWGTERSDAVYERLNPPAPIALDPDAANDATSPTLLPLGETRTDSAVVGSDEDWYEVRIPDDVDRLDIALGGLPNVGVTAHLRDTAGNDIPLATTTSSAGELVLAADIESGATYTLGIVQPPTSVIFAFDTSLSIGTLEPTVYQGLIQFTRDVQPGRENVNILPFGEQLLLVDWSDDPYLLQSTIQNYPRTSLSSDAEGALLVANDALLERDGNRAIVLITDGESGPTETQLTDLWPSLVVTAPRVFAVGIAGSTDAARGQDIMQDWAAVNAGSYVYVRDQGGMDIAFDRATTELRRPSIYTLTVTGTTAPDPTPEPTEPPATPETVVAPPKPTVEPTPESLEDGTVQITIPELEPGQTIPTTEGGSVAIILDTSGSMLQELEGSTRADIAKGALTDLVTETIPPGTTVSLRTFGDTPESCETILAVPPGPLDPEAMSETILAVPPGPLDPEAMSETIAGLPIVNLVRTPIGASLGAVRDDLGDGPGPKIVVLVTDGEETCGGDPAAAIEDLVASGIDVRVNIVGFALDDEALRDQFTEWAELGNGQYIDAGNAAELEEAVALAVLPTFDVIDEDGDVVATGQVGGPPVAVPPGTYTVVIDTDPLLTVEDLEVSPGDPTVVEIDLDTGPP